MSPLASILAEANRTAPTPPQTTIAPTNVAGIYANNDAQNMAAYQAQMQQQNAEFGGLAGLGAAGITALPKLLGGGAAAAGTGAATGGSSALASLLPFMIA